MIRVNSATADPSRHGAGKPGWRPSTEGTPTNGTALWHDHVQEETARAVEATGQTVDGSSLGQLQRALQGMLLNNWDSHYDASSGNVEHFNGMAWGRSNYPAAPGHDGFLMVGDANGSAAECRFVRDGNATRVGATLMDSVSTGKNVSLNDVCFSEALGMWIAVGDADGSDAYLLSATHMFGGGDFTERVNAKNYALNCVAVSPAGVVVALGVFDSADMYAVRSVDGINYTEIAVPGDSGEVVTSVCYAPELEAFVAVGYDTAPAEAVAWYSNADGTSWTKVAPPYTIVPKSVCWTGTRLVAVGDDGVWMTASAEDTWDASGTFGPGGSALDMVSVCALDDLVIAFGLSTFLFVSRDGGVTWEHGPRFASESFRAAAVGNGGFAACTGGGGISPGNFHRSLSFGTG